jgi:SPP1 gp7 family putative phage head morphogenesis protein
MARPAADPGAYPQALDWFRQRVPLADVEFDKLGGDAHERAFKVAGVAQLDLATQVWEAVDAAIAKGTTLADFQDAIGEKLAEAWGGERRPYRVETILRTNLQHSYSRGRWEQQSDPVVKQFRPFWEFSAVMDLRTTSICQECNGVVRPADDPFWRSRNPPLHHQCRSTVISLTEEQAQARGVTPTPPDATPADGFGQAPGADDWHPDLSKYPHELAAVAGAKRVASGR